MRGKGNYYADALIAAITPELARRLDIAAESSKKTFGEVVVKFLNLGASTPLFLGVGASTSNKKTHPQEKQK